MSHFKTSLNNSHLIAYVYYENYNMSGSGGRIVGVSLVSFIIVVGNTWGSFTLKLGKITSEYKQETARF